VKERKVFSLRTSDLDPLHSTFFYSPTFVSPLDIHPHGHLRAPYPPPPPLPTDLDKTLNPLILPVLHVCPLPSITHFTLKMHTTTTTTTTTTTITTTTTTTTTTTSPHCSRWNTGPQQLSVAKVSVVFKFF
jgi:hypothetical protein